ncbi:MAG: metalloregulator ArsR/SmtB family transcription factor [Acidimicrobiales bacterium]
MHGDELDELVRALSNRTRRTILGLCAQEFVSAGDIAAEIDLALASVSEHLKVLRKTGLVELERTGTKWLYRSHPDLIDEVLTALAADLGGLQEKQMNAPIVHFEVAGPDERSLHSFYRELFGWSVEMMGPGYSLMQTPDGSPNGAIREAEASELSIGVGVADLESAVEHAVSQGGSIVMAPTDNGYVNKAQVADPAGNLITLIENDERGE